MTKATLQDPMNNLTKNEIVALYRFLDGHLRYFDIRPSEEDFWSNTLKLQDLKSVRERLRKMIDNA